MKTPPIGHESSAHKGSKARKASHVGKYVNPPVKIDCSRSPEPLTEQGSLCENPASSS